MTATTGTRRATTRSVALASAAVAGVAALALPFAPVAAADDAHHGSAPAAERADAPAAATPRASEIVYGKTASLGGDDRDDAGQESQDKQDGDGHGERSGRDGHGSDRDRGHGSGSSQERHGDRGRGARYHEDGTLITVERHQQPEPQPASREQIDRWIDQALEIMDEHGIPGSYEGIYRNLMRESSGDPLTINLWDSNAHKNIPSKGLLQVIEPTFEQYHVEGTSTDIYDPVANIVAACNYAADRYGSMDNVDSAY